MRAKKSFFFFPKIRFKNLYYMGPHTCGASGAAAASRGHAQGVKCLSGTVEDRLGYTMYQNDRNYKIVPK